MARYNLAKENGGKTDADRDVGELFRIMREASDDGERFARKRAQIEKL